MATISNSNLIQPVYVPTFAQMASVPLQLGRLYYIVDINALWLYTDDTKGAPTVTNGVYNAGGGTFFGLAKGSALTGSNATPTNLGTAKPTGVPIIDTTWLPGTVDEIIEVLINRAVPLDSPDLFVNPDTDDIIVGKPKTIYLVTGQTMQSLAYNHASRINHSFRWSGSQYVDLDNDKFTLNELTNVTIATPLDNQVLTYEDGEWINKALPTASALLGLDEISRGLVYKTGNNAYATHALGGPNRYLRMNDDGTEMEWGTFSVGVTSVGLQMPQGFAVTGGPITGSGVLKAEIVGPLQLANPVTTGTPSVILGTVSGSDAVSTWAFVVSPFSGFALRGAAHYGATAFAPSGDPGTGTTTYHFHTSTSTWRVRTGTTGDTWTEVTEGNFSSGAALPGSPSTGDVFYKTTSQTGIYVYTSGITGVIDGSLYYNTDLNKVRLGKSGAYVSLVDEDDIASLYWIVA